MEVGGVIHFGEYGYEILECLYKSRGAASQVLLPSPDHRTEPDKRYYVVEHAGEKFWVKERLRDEIFWGTLEDEYRRIRGVSGIKHERDGVVVRAVSAHGLENNRLLLEYLEDHVPLSKKDVSDEWKVRVFEVVRGFLTEAGLKSTYDLSSNNLMIAPCGEVVLIDFEMADGKERLS